MRNLVYLDDFIHCVAVDCTSFIHLHRPHSFARIVLPPFGWLCFVKESGFLNGKESGALDATSGPQGGLGGVMPASGVRPKFEV